MIKHLSFTRVYIYLFLDKCIYFHVWCVQHFSFSHRFVHFLSNQTTTKKQLLKKIVIKELHERVRLRESSEAECGACTVAWVHVRRGACWRASTARGSWRGEGWTPIAIAGLRSSPPCDSRSLVPLALVYYPPLRRRFRFRLRLHFRFRRSVFVAVFFGPRKFPETWLYNWK